MKILLASFTLSFVFLAAGTAARAFTHPGLPLTLSDLEILKANLGTEPWKSAYASLAAAGQSQLTYTMSGPFASVSRTPDVNLGQWKNDMQAVYNLARMWYLTGNTAYAQKGRDILIAWAQVHKSFDGAEMYLSMGDYAYRAFGGADILRGTWPGWTQADTDTCKTYFNDVWWNGNGINIANPLRSSNQGILQLMAVVGVAVFNDDEVKFAQCLQAFRADVTGGLPDSLSNGEIGDSGRDQGHAFGELQHLALIAEIFWKQGVDVYADSNNRLLAAGEFYARYNLSVNTPYIPFGTKYDYYPNHGGAPNSSAQPPDVLSLIHNAYVTRKGMQAPYVSQYRNTRPENADSFVYRKSADRSTAVIPSALTPPAVTAAVTTGFLNADIGGATPAGAASYSEGTWTVTGAGADIWGNSDSYHYTYKEVTGDFTLVAKVTSLQNTNPGAKAGLVMRDTLAPNAPRRVYFGFTPGSTKTLVDSHQRGYTANSHNDPDELTHDGVPLPQWLKLQRIGTRVMVFHSDDGGNWIPLQNNEYAGWSGPAFVGLSVCSKVNGTLTTATFSDVRITGGDGNEDAKAPATPRYVYAAPGSRQVPLRWLEAAYATSYNVKRATASGGPYAPIATVAASSYVDFNVSPDTSYYYVVSAVNAVGESSDSPEEPITTNPLPGHPKLSGTLIGTAGNGAAKVFDNDFTTYFDAAPTGSGTWVGLDLGGNRVITEIRYVPRAGQQGRMTGGQFQASNTADFSSGVVTFYTVPSAPPYTLYTSRTISDPAGYRYVRYLGPPNSFSNVSEIEFYGYAAGTTPPSPPAPAGLTATAPSSSEIELNWTAATAVPGYYILKRATTSGGPYTTIATDLTTPYYRDSDLQSGANYYYVLSYVTIGGEGAGSPEAALVSAPPSGLTATPASGQVTLSWTASPGATSYSVKRGTASGGPYAPIATVTGASYTDTGLTNGTTYYYVIAALNPGGQGANSIEVSATPAAPAAQSSYWDTTAAPGLLSGSGTWDVANTTLWSATSAGTSNPLLPWVDGGHARFQTGGVNTVTLAGTVRVSSLTQAFAATATTVTGGTLQIDTDAGVTNGLTGNNSALALNSPLVLNSPSVVINNQAANGSVSLGGVISESGGSRALVKTGAGNVTLSTANTFSGGFTITGGQVSAVANFALFGSGPITLASTTGIVSPARTLYVVNTPFTFNNAFVVQSGTQNRLEFSRSGTATLPLNGAITGGGLLQISTGFNPTIQFNGNVTGFTGALQFVGNGGTGGATSNYDFTNTATIGAPNATIRLESAVNSPNAANLVLLRWNPVTTTSATVPLGALSGSFGGAQTSANIVVTNAKAGTTATWRIGGLATSTTFAGVVQNGIGTSALEKIGAGTLTLSGANTYTGVTTVNAGQLVVTGSLAAGSVVTVNSGSTLAGTGTIGGSTTVAAGGHLAPGIAGAGTLALAGPFTLTAGGIMDFDLGPTSDLLTVGGAYTAPAGGTVTLNVTALGGFGAGGYPLITGATGLSAGSFTLGTVPTGYTYALAASGGTLTLTATAWTALETWRFGQFGTVANTGSAADTADPDADGLSNLLEYALGTNPLATSAMPTVVRSPSTGFLEITFTRQRSDLTYVVEASDDLVTWTILVTNPGTVGATVTVSDTPSAGPRRFLHLRVVEDL